MIDSARLSLDTRDVAQIATDLLTRRAGYLPRWAPTEGDPDAAFTQVVARQLHAILQRLAQSPEKNKLAFLEQLGIDLIRAQAARAPIVIQLSDQARDARLPAGTRLTAPPPPERTEQIFFETERGAGLAAAKLKQVVSLWPGRDQCIDHSSAALAGTAFQPFKKSELKDTPHILYLAHDTLLALAGKTVLSVEMELTTPSSEALDILWEYWDGKVWRGFKDMRPACGEAAAQYDGTRGFTRSGRFRLETDCAETSKTTVNGVKAFWIRGQLREPLLPTATTILPEVDRIRLSTVIERPLAKLPISQILPDQAFANGVNVDLTQSFFPFGLQPQPGDAFYFTNAEIFTKPGAVMEVEIKKAFTPQESFKVSKASSTEVVPSFSLIELFPILNFLFTAKAVLAWEYWDGKQWAPLAANLTKFGKSNSDDLPTFVFSLTIPGDMAETKVNDVPGLWMRIRLVSGGMFQAEEVLLLKEQKLQFAVPRPVAFAGFRLGYTWQFGPFHPERVLAYNDFQYEDRTEESRWPGKTFQPFRPLRDLTPAVYLGFTGKLPVDRLNLFFDILEERGVTEGPALVWEYWDGFAWKILGVEDETRHLRIPGMVSFIGPEDSQPLARFDAPLHWLRARLKEDGPPGEPTLNGIFPNAVWAVQRQTISDEPLGASNGLPDQVFTFRQVPVLEGEALEVREVSGARANVEWRIVATELYRGDARALRELEALLQGPQPEIETGPLRLKRDRNRHVTEVWIRWRGCPHLFGSEANDRHYVVERARGRLHFGDGIRGRIPPAGAAILARKYHAGGGTAGNVAVRAITQIQAAIAGIESVFNPKPAEGGADAEPLEALTLRGAQTLRHRGRALRAQDYETLAREASPAVAVARAIPLSDSAGHERPGWITLLIIPYSKEPRPWPSFGLRQDVQTFLESHAPADLAGANHIYVTGPDYLAVDVAVSVKPSEPAEAGAVEQRVREALAKFFDPLFGGQEGRGWGLGRGVFLSDLAGVLERVEGLDYVRELTLSLAGVPQGERVAVPENAIVVGGESQITLLLE